MCKMKETMNSDVKVGDWIFFYDQGDEEYWGFRVEWMDEEYFGGGKGDNRWNCRRECCVKVSFPLGADPLGLERQ